MSNSSLASSGPQTPNEFPNQFAPADQQTFTDANGVTRVFEPQQQPPALGLYPQTQGTIEVHDKKNGVGFGSEGCASVRTWCRSARSGDADLVSLVPCSGLVVRQVRPFEPRLGLAQGRPELIASPRHPFFPPLYRPPSVTPRLRSSPSVRTLVLPVYGWDFPPQGPRQALCMGAHLV